MCSVCLSINFKYVGGMECVKEEISLKIIKLFQYKDLYVVYGKKIGGGIFMYGFFGCGKMYLVCVIVGEINVVFISVGISDIFDMWIGCSEKNLYVFFEKVCVQVLCVLFFDEVDVFGVSCNDMC